MGKKKGKKGGSDKPPITEEPMLFVIGKADPENAAEAEKLKPFSGQWRTAEGETANNGEPLSSRAFVFRPVSYLSPPVFRC
jgi:hypothetical protein